MFKRIDHVEIIPADYQRTLDFYTGILEFRVKERITMAAGPLEEIAFLELGDTVVEFLKVSQAAPAPAAPFTVGYRGIALEVENMEEAVAYLTARGVPITWGPMNIGGTVQRAEIRDPDGLTIELRQW